MYTAKKKPDNTATLEKLDTVEGEIRALARLREADYEAVIRSEDPERAAREMSKEYRHLGVWVTYEAGDPVSFCVAPTLPTWLGEGRDGQLSASHCLDRAEEFLKNAPAYWPLRVTLVAFARGVSRTKAQDDKIKQLEKQVQEMQNERQRERVTYMPFHPGFGMRFPFGG
jgi:hypothetical protein